MQGRVTSNPLKLRENLETQLDELETLKSMFYNPGELRVEDLEALEEIRNYVDNKTAFIPPYLDFTINLLISDLKFELCITLPHEYPDVEPDCFVRNHKQNRDQHAKINKDLANHLATLSRGEPCVFSAICWLQENAENYIDRTEEVGVQQKSKKDETLVRYWIYSHHIYSKTKRREILNLASLLNISGFCMPGKPGIICVEGAKSDVDEWWQTIKAMNWKRIFCKVDEHCKDEKEGFLKFKHFEEVVFQNNSIKCNHMDMGELYKYLEDHESGYIFKDLFGVEAKTSS